MAVAITRVTGADSTFGNKRLKVRDLTFSGNYATGGESVTPANVGLKVIDQVLGSNVAAAADLVTANPVFYNHATSKFVFYEDNAVAAAASLTEKNNAEAYATGTKMRVTFLGH